MRLPYESRGLQILTRIVVINAGANLLGAIEVAPIIGLLLMSLGDGTHANLTHNQILLGGWGLVVVLLDGAWRWRQPRVGRIRRWLSPYEGGSVVFVPGWIMGICLLAVAIWARFQGYR
jgi:hypothetical protein